MNARQMKPPPPIPKQQAVVQPKPTWTLADVSEGIQDLAYRVMLSGIEGIGKSTFGSHAPKPIFIGAEDGSGRLNVKRMKNINSWLDVVHGVELLGSQPHDYQTAVIDTLDHLEPMLWDFICARDRKSSIEDYGYGKGYTAALDEWRRLLKKLEKLRDRNVHVVLLAHTHLKTFKNPEGPDYDRYELKLNLKAGGLLKEWCDAVLFSNYETWSVKQEEKDRKGKGISSGARYIYTERTAAYDAKNRYGLPPQLPLSWDEFVAAVKSGQPAEPAILVEQINRQAALLEPATQKSVAEALARAGNDATKLSHLLNAVNAKQPAGQAEQEN